MGKVYNSASREKIGSVEYCFLDIYRMLESIMLGKPKKFICLSQRAYFNVNICWHLFLDVAICIFVNQVI